MTIHTVTHIQKTNMWSHCRTERFKSKSPYPPFTNLHVTHEFKKCDISYMMIVHLNFTLHNMRDNLYELSISCMIKIMLYDYYYDYAAWLLHVDTGNLRVRTSILFPSFTKLYLRGFLHSCNLFSVLLLSLTVK